MSYNYIVNPKTNRKVNIFNKVGKQILKNYVNIWNRHQHGGTETPPPPISPPKLTRLMPCPHRGYAEKNIKIWNQKCRNKEKGYEDEELIYHYIMCPLGDCRNNSENGEAYCANKTN